MKILLCPDKFKGSLNAREVCDAIERALLSVMHDVVVEALPLADGGEGTCQLLTDWAGGKTIDMKVHDPLFRPVSASYGISSDGLTAFVEMASASGLMLLRPEERNPLLTSSVGTGEMIADALQRGARQVILGIGGSATNDGGIGMATALGYAFCDAGGKPLSPVGENLLRIDHIDTKAINPLLSKASFITLCDVENPLWGPDGAAYVYAPQKGADQASVERLDAGLKNFERVVTKALNATVDFPGAGAAGGMGAGCRVFLNASMEKGIFYVARITGLQEKIRSADLLITGEGKIDHQTLSGKVVAEVISRARKANKPVVAVCGISELTGHKARALGLAGVISLVDENISAESAIKNASALIEQKVAREIGKYVMP